MKKLFTLFLVVMISGCAIVLPKNLYIQKGKADPNTEGLAILKMHGNGNGSFISYKPNHAMQLFLKEVDSHRYTFVIVNDKGYRAIRLPAGTWYLAGAVANDVLLGYGDAKDTAYNPDKALPFRPFTIKSGETIYLGNLELEGVLYEQRITGESENISYKLTDEFESAKQEIGTILDKKGLGFSPMRKVLLEEINKASPN